MARHSGSSSDRRCFDGTLPPELSSSSAGASSRISARECASSGETPALHRTSEYSARLGCMSLTPICRSALTSSASSSVRVFSSSRAGRHAPLVSIAIGGWCSRAASTALRNTESSRGASPFVALSAVVYASLISFQSCVGSRRSRSATRFLARVAAAHSIKAAFQAC